MKKFQNSFDYNLPFTFEDLCQHYSKDGTSYPFILGLMTIWTKYAGNSILEKPTDGLDLQNIKGIIKANISSVYRGDIPIYENLDKEILALLNEMNSMSKS